ncbi:hypothetical protein RQP46_000003 [Phenoliferia psychrophenolica]
MATLQSLPTELLAHILHLSTEGESAEKQQRARFAFGLVARAFFLATANATDFYVAGDKQAHALVSKLEQEKKWATQEERKSRSGRSTRASFSVLRTSNIRRLSLVVDNKKSAKGIVKLLRATPNLVAVDLNAFDVTTQYRQQRAASLVQLEDALSGMSTLQELRLRFVSYRSDALLRLLTPLKELRELDVHITFCHAEGDYESQLKKLALPHLHTLRLRLTDAFPVALLGALTTGTSGRIQSLDLKTTNFFHDNIIETIIPYLSHLVHFTWTSVPETPFRNKEGGFRAELLALLGAMTGLHSIRLAFWVLEAAWDDTADDPFDRLPIDPKILDTLTTLPSLDKVDLVVRMGHLDEEVVIEYIKSHTLLRSLCIHLETTSGWTREQQVRVEEAAEEAGVAFLYTTGRVWD